MMKPFHIVAALLASVFCGCRHSNIDGCKACPGKSDQLQEEREIALLRTEFEAEFRRFQNYDGTYLPEEWKYPIEMWDVVTNLYGKAYSLRIGNSRTEEETARHAARRVRMEGNMDLACKYCADECEADNTGSASWRRDFGETSYICLEGLRALLLERKKMAVWERIENATGLVGGKQVVFCYGDAHIVLPWRLFDPTPSSEQYEWWVFMEPCSVFSFKGRDYVIVRFAYEKGIAGCPTTTEERVLLEIDNGRISRYVGLHNTNEYESPKLDDRQATVTIEGRDGYNGEIRFVIDLKDMKIMSADSVLAFGFAQDKYDVVFCDTGAAHITTAPSGEESVDGEDRL